MRFLVLFTIGMLFIPLANSGDSPRLGAEGGDDTIEVSALLIDTKQESLMPEDCDDGPAPAESEPLNATVDADPKPAAQPALVIPHSDMACYVSNPVPAAAAPAAAPAATQPIVVTATDVVSLLVVGSGITRQPSSSEVLVTKDLIVYSDPSVRLLNTVVLGTSVEVEVTPVSYHWDWGDGTFLDTAQAGAPWPHHSVSHRYATTGSGRRLTLTTTWGARFRPVGVDEWTRVAGVITSRETSTPFDVVRAVAYLTDEAEESLGH